jgi:aspartate aminotransferase
MGFYELAEKALALERAGKRLIRLNVGDTNLPTPQAAIGAAAASIRGTKSGYVSSAGISALRERIAQREGCAIGNVVVGPGSKHLIFGLLSVLGKRDVVFPSPHWPAYGLAAKQLKIKTRAIGTKMEDGWSFALPELSEKDLFIICNPLNPTSTIYDSRLIEDSIAEAARKGAAIVLDEAYKGLAFKKIPRYGDRGDAGKGGNVIRVRSFSKEFNMEGWRLGYAIASEDISKKLIAFNQITSTCVAPFVQEAGIACLDHEKEVLEANRRVWLARSLAAQGALSEAGFAFAKPEAGIYVFATHPRMKDADGFTLRLLDEQGIAVSAGSDFGQRGFIRICVNQPEGTLREAIARMGELLQ